MYTYLASDILLQKKNAKYVSPFNSSNFPFGCMPLKKKKVSKNRMQLMKAADDASYQFGRHE